ncbi:MAG: hypothetical protein LBR11_05685 [Deltaproteobacteria bacterium]|nr:hypothetical protein [Deltaproteobacteria bacterium]
MAPDQWVGKDPEQKRDIFLEALQWTRRATEGGHPPAMTALGEIFEFGSQEISHILEIDDQEIRVARDQTEARRWYQKAAGLGDLEATLKLAYFFAAGQGGPQDQAAAEKMTRRALVLTVERPDAPTLTRLA